MAPFDAAFRGPVPTRGRALGRGRHDRPGAAPAAPPPRRRSVAGRRAVAGHRRADAALAGAPAVGRLSAMSKRPRVNQDLLHRQAQVAVLGGLLRGEDIDALVEAVAPSHVRGWFTPDVAMLELAVTALDLASRPGLAPLEYDDLRERYLPEAEFRGRVDHRSSQYALYAAVDLRRVRAGDLRPSRGRPRRCDG